MTHTPGPWHQANTTEIWGGPSTCKHVAQCGNRKQDSGSALKSVEEVAANSRLIAAAPELLEALKIVLIQFGPYKDGQGAAKFHAVNIASKAIAKAEGRPYTQEVLDRAAIAKAEGK